MHLRSGGNFHHDTPDIQEVVPLVATLKRGALAVGMALVAAFLMMGATSTAASAAVAGPTITKYGTDFYYLGDDMWLVGNTDNAQALKDIDDDQEVLCSNYDTGLNKPCVDGALYNLDGQRYVDPNGSTYSCAYVQGDGGSAYGSWDTVPVPVDNSDADKRVCVEISPDEPTYPKKVWVCKYVGKPGEDERLQEGGNPIQVSIHSIGKGKWNGDVPGWFSDAHDRSYVLDYVIEGKLYSSESCPQPVTPTDTPENPDDPEEPTDNPTDEPETPVKPEALSGTDISTSEPYCTASESFGMVTIATTPWTQDWVLDEDGSWVLGEKVYGEPEVTREGTNELTCTIDPGTQSASDPSDPTDTPAVDDEDGATVTPTSTKKDTPTIETTPVPTAQRLSETGPSGTALGLGLAAALAALGGGAIAWSRRRSAL